MFKLLDNRLASLPWIIVVGFASALVGMFIPGLPLKGDFFLALGSAFGLTVAFIFVALTALDNRRYIFHPLWLLLASYSIGYLIRSYYIMFLDPTLMIGISLEDGPYYLAQALQVVFVALASLLIGYKGKIGIVIANRLPIFRAQFSRKRLLLVTILIYALGLYASITIVRSTSFSWNLEAFTSKRLESSIILLSLSRFMAVGVYLHLIYTASLKRFSKSSWCFYFLALIYAAFFTIYASSRSDFVALIFINAILIHHLIRRLTLPRVMIVALAVLLLSSAIVGLRNKRSDLLLALRESFAVDNAIQSLVASRDLADITTVAHIVRYVDETGDLRLGETMINLFTRFVPRSVWPNKPLNVGVEVSDLFYDEALRRRSDSGVPPSLVAELFWNFHLPGVILGMFIFGTVIRMIYEYLNRSSSNPWTVFLFANVAIYIFDQSRADIALSLGRHIFIMIPVLTIVAIITWKNRSPFEQSTDLYSLSYRTLGQGERKKSQLNQETLSVTTQIS